MRVPEPEQIRQAIAERRQLILEWTKTLIRFASENRPPAGMEAEAQEFLAGECCALGWQVDLFRPDEVEGIERHPYWLSGREYLPGRRNLVARWLGAGTPPRKAQERSLLFSGHMDVAPFEPDAWKVCRPYEPVLREGRLYGRGSADMKGGVAAAFWALRILHELGYEPQADILFESVVDEEFAGGNGTLASRLKGYNAELAVLGEPTRMEVCPACLGAFLGDITLRGKAGMPYMGSEIPNPIFGAARVVERFKEWQRKWRAMNAHPLFAEPDKELNVVLSMIDSKVPGEFTQMGTPLITTLSWIVWCHPGMSEQEFFRVFRTFWEEWARHEEELKAFTLELKQTYHFVRPAETAVSEPGVQCAIEAFRQYTGREPKIGGAAFSCDLAHYAEPGGMPCLILGPRGDNLHAPDEWVLLEDILELAGIYALLATWWCGEQ